MGILGLKWEKNVIKNDGKRRKIKKKFKKEKSLNKKNKRKELKKLLDLFKKICYNKKCIKLIL